MMQRETISAVDPRATREVSLGIVRYAWIGSLALYAILIHGGLVVEPAALWVTDLAWTAASVIATVSSWRTSREVSGARRVAWTLFAAGCGAWFLGQMVWNWEQLFGHVRVPFPSAADYGYTAFAFLFAAGFYVLRNVQPARRWTPQRIANLTLILCSLAVVINTMVLDPVMRTQRSPYFVTVALVESLSITATFIIGTYFLWSYRWGGETRAMLLMIVGFGIHAFCGLIYTHELLIDQFVATDFVNIGWIIAFGLQHGAAIEQRRIARDPKIRVSTTGEGWLEALVPAVLLMFVAATAALMSIEPSTRLILINAALLAVFAVLLGFRESWMYLRGLHMQVRLDRARSEIESARDRLRRTEGERQELERNVDVTARAGGVGLWDWNLRTNEVRYSREWKRQLGYEEHELTDSFDEWYSRVHPSDAERAMHAVREYLDHPVGEFFSELRLRHRDGSYRWILSQANVVCDADGAASHMHGSHIDITARKQMEMALRQSETRYRELADALERRVAERTADLSEAYRESQSFAHAVAHDLRAPLRAIEGFSHLLMESCGAKLDPTERGYIDRVRRGALQMASLIEGLLAYSRMEHREMLLGRIDLRSMLQELVGEVEERTRTCGARIEMQLPSVEVRGDREGLGVVFRNLIENALKFTQQGVPPLIEIGARVADGSVVVSVRDNGIGFDQDYHDKIFEIFQRLHGRDEYEGTGIGLALARKAMQRMGGRIWAESRAGTGATFFVELPRAEWEGAAFEAAPSRVE
jgi:PAS domain S-box-containing protein